MTRGQTHRPADLEPVNNAELPANGMGDQGRVDRSRPQRSQRIIRHAMPHFTSFLLLVIVPKLVGKLLRLSGIVFSNYHIATELCYALLGELTSS